LLGATLINRLKIAIWLGLVLPSVLAQSPRIDLSNGKRISSLLRVLANPESFHGKEIQIIGFLHLTFEGDALYLHREDLAYNLLGNSIWVVATKEMYANIKQLDKQYVIIRGTFDANDHGHMGLHAGALTNITRCSVWADLKQPRWGDPPPPPSPIEKDAGSK
jgi:hypothetical protein